MITISADPHLRKATKATFAAVDVGLEADRATLNPARRPDSWWIHHEAPTAVRSFVGVSEDLLLGPPDLADEREKALLERFGALGEADVGAGEELEEAGPAVDEGGELGRREALGAAEEELLDQDAEGRRHLGPA